MSPALVLVTGSTGFIGGALLARLLAEAVPPRVAVLVRAHSRDAAQERLQVALTRFMGAQPAARAIASLAILTGDLADPESYEHPLLDEITHVLHAGACTSFRSQRRVRQTNVLGTLALAHRMRRAPRLRRFLHVGTAYCCGDHPAAVVHEDDSPSSAHAYVNEYTRSKAEAEALLAATAPDLPLVVARPSVVVGHTRFGCAPSGTLFWYYRALATLGRIPFSGDARRDIVPVDYVADALAGLLFRPTLKHRVYHVSAGELASEVWRDILRAFANAGASVCAAAPARVAPDQLAATGLRALFTDADCSGDEPPSLVEERLRVALSACARFGALPAQCFDHHRLLSEGFAPPPRFTSYLASCVETSRAKSIYRQLRDDEC
jgi:nucleoside-diphosphate-sugar epimerase